MMDLEARDRFASDLEAGRAIALDATGLLTFEPGTPEFEGVKSGLASLQAALESAGPSESPLALLARDAAVGRSDLMAGLKAHAPGLLPFLSQGPAGGPAGPVQLALAEENQAAFRGMFREGKIAAAAVRSALLGEKSEGSLDLFALSEDDVIPDEESVRSGMLQILFMRPGGFVRVSQDVGEELEKIAFLKIHA
ncbi:MAG: hypothetical protein HY548_08895 [Elusimicrobia bacterium]|nr:hypothetical protein [Elusimicrobiota bacterium]